MYEWTGQRFYDNDDNDDDDDSDRDIFLHTVAHDGDPIVPSLRLDMTVMAPKMVPRERHGFSLRRLPVTTRLQ